MNYYLALDGSVHALEAAEFESLLPKGCVSITPQQAAGRVAPTDAQVSAERWRVYQAQAQSALDASDITLLRCVEHSVTVPAEWVAYRAALRAIVRAASGDASQPLPTRPAYPAGT